MYGYSSVLITGGAGFIGSHLVDRLIAENLEVVVLDNLQGGRVENIHKHVGKKNFRFIRGDVRDYGLIKRLVKDVDAIFHQAAIVSVPRSLEDPVFVNDVNVNGTLNLLKTSINSGVKRFVYASSCAMYGDRENLPMKEDMILEPLSPYGVSKLAAESYARAFYKVFGLETVCLRYFNVYGSRQVQGPYSGVITQFIDCLAKNLPLVIFGDGEQTRDFVHVQDVVEANMLALKNGKIIGETYNIATGVATTINQLAKILMEITNKTELRLVRAEPRKGDIKHSVADISKARRELRYKPRISLEEGLKDLAKSLEMRS
jgi:nucleoside-diphosphate-sugar epimerase